MIGKKLFGNRWIFDEFSYLASDVIGGGFVGRQGASEVGKSTGEGKAAVSPALIKYAATLLGSDF